MRLKFAAITTLIAALSASSQAFGQFPFTQSNKQSLVAQAHNPEIAIAQKKITRRARWAGWKLARDTFRG